MEEIQKSIRLINFSDANFDTDTDERERERDVDNIGKPVPMLSTVSFIKYLLKRGNKLVDSDEPNSIFGKKKHVQFEEILFSYFNQYEKDEEILMEILVTYSPFVVVSEEQFELLTRKESERVKEIEMKCFGSNFGEYKVKNLLEYSDKIFKNNKNSKSNFDYQVLCKRISCQLMLKGKNFDAKGLSRTLSILEAAEYSKLNFYDFYKKKCSSGNFILIFNKLTNFLISEILTTETKKERKMIVKRILKLAKELANIGAMNSLKACMAALESNPIHRLKLVKDQKIKYQKRFKELSTLTSAEKNFKEMRERACIIPWLGIILRDFTFIKEIVYQKPTATSTATAKSTATATATATGSVNIPLALCLRKLLNSMGAAREACEQFIKESEQEELKKAAVMGKWLGTVDIVYESEESQYDRSLKITSEEE